MVELIEPIVEQIAAALATAIDGITEDNGYLQDLSAVRPTRPSFDPDTDAAPENGKVVIVQTDPEPDSENSTEGNPPAQAWLQPFALVCFVIASDASTMPIDTLVNRARCDIEKKVMEDPQWGGLALDTELHGSMRFNEGQASSGVVVLIAVHYRTRENNPYQSA